MESTEKGKCEEKIKSLMSYNKQLLKRKYERSKSDAVKKKNAIKNKLNKVIIQEKQKVQKYMHEVNTLKLDNMR